MPWMVRSEWASALMMRAGTLSERIHTRYTQNFGLDRELVKNMVATVVKTGDLDDLIFRLKDAKAAEVMVVTRG